MRLCSRFWAICWTLILMGSAGWADSTATFQVTGVAGENLGGVYVAPYMGHLSSDGGQTYGATFDVICDDFTHDINIGDSWNANITSLGVASPNLANTRFGGTDGLAVYSEVIWLADQMNFGAQNNSDLQWAIWDITDPGLSLAGLPPSDQISVMSLVSQAGGHTAGVDLSGWEVITPTAAAGSPTIGYGQEYLTHVPEPSSFALLLSGLAGSLGVVRRRLKSE